jgi:hypothetical protein
MLTRKLDCLFETNWVLASSRKSRRFHLSSIQLLRTEGKKRVLGCPNSCSEEVHKAIWKILRISDLRLVLLVRVRSGTGILSEA